jgi:hypothetical protein
LPWLTVKSENGMDMNYEHQTGQVPEASTMPLFCSGSTRKLRGSLLCFFSRVLC